MHLSPAKVIKLALPYFVVLFVFSCSKDTDLLADAVLNDPESDIQERERNADDPESAEDGNLVEKTVTLNPTEDAYVQGPEGYDLTIMKLGENNRTSYMLFDLSPIPGEITNASLEFTIDSDAGDGTIDIFKGDSNNWDEKNLSRDNAPNIDIPLGAVNNQTYFVGETFTTDLEISGLDAEKTSLIMTHTGQNDLAIASKENEIDIRPKLVITYMAPEGSEDIDPTTPDETEEPPQEDEEEKEYGPLKAFPSAYGAGSNATGGRGGVVYRVTNLNNGGPGSFRAAVEASGPRTVVFDVSGTIELTSDLYIRNGDLTIAGQTAPVGGIAITGKIVYFQNLENLILRYIRFRPNWTGNTNIDAVNFNKVKNVIVDHCSVSWGADEAVSFVGSADGVFVTNNVTLQRSLMAYSSKGTILGYTNYQDTKPHGITGGNFSLLNNCYAHISHRFPNPISHDRIDVINNVVHDWRQRLIVMNAASDIQLNAVNNYYQRSGISNVISGALVNMVDYDYNYTQQIYAAGNIIDQEFTNPQADNRVLFKYWALATPGSEPLETVESNYMMNSMFPQLGNALPVQSASAAFDDVKSDVGANAVIDGQGNVIFGTDTIDAELLNDVANNISHNYDWRSDRSTEQRYIAWHAAVSSTPVNTHPANYDTDGDGMPDEWEQQQGLNPNDANDGRQDANGDGYTNLEDYLNLVDF